MKEINDNYGEKLLIKQITSQKGMTMSELAKSIGISAPALTQSLQRNMTVKRLYEIADALDCSPTDFFPKDKKVHTTKVGEQNVSRDDEGNVVVTDPISGNRFVVAPKDIFKVLSL